MATLTQLRSKVTDVVRDSYLRNINLVDYINRGVTAIAGGMVSGFPGPDGRPAVTSPLPDLFTNTTITTITDTYKVVLAGTFQRNLQYCCNAAGTELDIYGSMVRFAQDYQNLDSTAAVASVIEQGGFLYYQGAPAATEVLTIHYFRKPVDMALGTSTPDGIPEHLHYSLLVNYAAYQIYELIGKDAEAARHKTFFKEALIDLELSIPYDTRSVFLGS